MTSQNQTPRILLDAKRIKSEADRIDREAMAKREIRILSQSLIFMVGIAACASLLGLAAFTDPDNATGYVFGAFLIAVYAVVGVWEVVIGGEKKEENK